MKIGYFGTAIPEAFFNGSDVSLAYHKSNEIVLKVDTQNLTNFQSTNQFTNYANQLKLILFNLFSKLKT